MKKQLLVALSFICFIIIAASCTKSNDKPGSSMSATVGSTAFKASGVTYSKAAGYLHIDGSSDKKHIVLNVYDFDNANGVFLFDGSDNRNYAYYTDGTTQRTAITGYLNLNSTGTSYTTGSFNFMTTDSTVISKGVLELNY